MNCMGYCEETRLALHHDPKTPPLDVEKCLCTDCCIAHIDEVLEELEEQIDEMRQLRHKVSTP